MSDLGVLLSLVRVFTLGIVLGYLGEAWKKSETQRD